MDVDSPVSPVTTTDASAPKKRKRTTDSGDSRRLRRSHEACSRCRAKKIKCDSRHPRCSACANAGIPCVQVDRARNTLTPRGHLERVEFQLAQSIILLRHLTGRPHFDLFDLDSALVDSGLDPNPPPLNTVSYEPLLNMYTTAFPPPEYYAHINDRKSAPDPEPERSPTPPPPPPQPSQSTQTDYRPISPRPRHMPVEHHVKGQDPNSNDLSSTQSLAKNFGVSADIVSAIAANQGDREDLAVGSSGLTSGRDRSIHEAATPRDTASWITVTVRRGSNAFANPPHIATVIPDLSGAMDIWLPKDRAMVDAIVEVYFARLNLHRPVFSQRDFMRSLDELYAGQLAPSGESNTPHDPGFLCSFYLVLALGTLSDLNNRSVHHQMDYSPSQQLLVKNLMPPDWPEHDEFFERALSVKPDLRVTISSLQALILLHWYLYTERQGRTLWRLVGSLVRLSVELGLHHDPTTQLNAAKQRVFTDDECLLRINLWGIILIHDRGTSILLGRPIGIAPSDSNTPRPSHAKVHGFSEHFELSHPVAEIQADIINSLYSPARQKGDALMRNATRVLKSMSEFRRSLPERYQNYFGGTEDWSMDDKAALVREIKEDEGLTLLKIGIARLLLLRALFSSSELHYEHRHKALVDAIVTAHNVIIVHSQLIRFPDIGFLTSPIPLHIAAMVILYGQMSNCDGMLTRQMAIDDLWLALDMLPRFRWRWERKDLNGSHPLIFELASHVMGVDLHAVKPSTQPVLLCEPDWEDSALPSPLSMSQHTSPAPGHAYPKQLYGVQRVHAPPASNGGGAKHLVEVPPSLFFPFYPEAANPASPPTSTNGLHEPSYGHILAAAATHGQHGSYVGQGSYDTYISEEHSPATRRVQWENNANMAQSSHRTYGPPPS
uniref:Zn(2)-C6 fungal-type domain-containing protein n=1 Tax=Mycena chlorophos TaxID=658473 RepID=A0ABQ0MCX5_MYCCL|nr:predicted protein [Mycena chlorophos]